MLLELQQEGALRGDVRKEKKAEDEEDEGKITHLLKYFESGLINSASGCYAAFFI